MLVIISDLHFTDGTTSNRDAQGNDFFNVSPRAFSLLLSKVAGIVHRRAGRGAAVRSVTFVYDGDIFDPLRTRAWFAAADRPWSVPLRKRGVNAVCYRILKRIVRHNREALEWLSGTHPRFSAVWNMAGMPKAVREPKRVFVPGNHDRLINLHRPSRRLVHRCLLNQSASECFANILTDKKHQTLVMHGHESDPFNCEFDENGDPDYATPPIGDAMTTMLFARLAHLVRRLQIPAQAKRRFADLDNVRPHLSGVRYVQNVIRHFRIRRKVDSTVRRVVKDFENLPFYKRWQNKHDRPNSLSDEADKLQLALRAIRLLGTSVPAGLLEGLAAFVRDDSASRWADKLLRQPRNRNIRYCVLGHTHEPRHVPICRRHGMEKHYLNSGTFRSTFTGTLDQKDFFKFQRMSFVIIYGPGEYDAAIETPLYEMWAGLRACH